MLYISHYLLGSTSPHHLEEILNCTIIPATSSDESSADALDDTEARTNNSERESMGGRRKRKEKRTLSCFIMTTYGCYGFCFLSPGILWPRFATSWVRAESTRYDALPCALSSALSFPPGPFRYCDTSRNKTMDFPIRRLDRFFVAFHC